MNRWVTRRWNGSRVRYRRGRAGSAPSTSQLTPGPWHAGAAVPAAPGPRSASPARSARPGDRGGGRVLGPPVCDVADGTARDTAARGDPHRRRGTEHAVAADPRRRARPPHPRPRRQRVRRRRCRGTRRPGHRRPARRRHPGRPQPAERPVGCAGVGTSAHLRQALRSMDPPRGSTDAGPPRRRAHRPIATMSARPASKRQAANGRTFRRLRVHSF
jgi:hypothetical protein